MSALSGRIAVGSILTECNHIGGSPIDLDWFERYDLQYGDDMLSLDSGVVGGGLTVLRESGCDIAPLLNASTCPGGYLTASCYGTLKSELLRRLQDALPVDGVLLLLHGAAAAEDIDDLEGDLITAVRERVGDGVRIVATLDLHAHVSAAMVRSADALVAWETYPHRDAFSTGQRGARLLVDAVSGRCNPTMAMAKVPVLTGGVRGSTAADEPFGRLMSFGKRFEQAEGVLSVSVFLVHPYLDAPGMGSGGLVVTDGDLDKAKRLARQIADRYWQARHDLEQETHSPAAAIERGLQTAGGPVLLVEAADCAGGGASGDSVATLKALLALGEGAPDSLVPVVDPEAAARCHEAGAGAELTLDLGHRLDPKWGGPVQVSGRVVHLSDGKFRYAGGIWDNVEGDMGPTAVLAAGRIRVLVNTHATYDWADEQFRSVGIDPLAAKFVVVKNPMNFRNVYADAASAVFILDTPGPTPASVRNVAFRKLQRPYFPVDIDIPDLQPTVLS